jgi:hypothetical protein
MKSVLALFTLVLTIAVSSCSSSKKSTGVWINTEKIQGKSFSKIFIVVLTADVEARAKLENDLAAEAEKRGIESVKSIEVMPPSLTTPTTPSKDEIAAKVKEGNCDGVFVASLLKQEEDVRYIPGTTAYTIMPYYTYHGTWFGYYSRWAPMINNPGYYTKEKSYFMQSNLYDVATEEIMWSVQSEVFNPSSLNKFSKYYTATLIKQLEKEGLLRK